MVFVLYCVCFILCFFIVFIYLILWFFRGLTNLTFFQLKNYLWEIYESLKKEPDFARSVIIIKKIICVRNVNYQDMRHSLIRKEGEKNRINISIVLLVIVNQILANIITKGMKKFFIIKFCQTLKSFFWILNIFSIL